MWKKLAFPVGLGLAAAVMNWVNVTQKIEPELYIVVKNDVAKGQPITPADLAPLPLPRGLGRVSKSLYPWAERADFFGKAAPRTFKHGDVLFQRDFDKEANRLHIKGPNERAFLVRTSNIPIVPQLLQPGQLVEFLITTGSFNSSNKSKGEDTRCGPFRVVSVDDEIDAVSDRSDQHRRASQPIISVLLETESNGLWKGTEAKRLVAAISGSSGEKVTGILLLNDESGESTQTPTSQDTDDENGVGESQK